MPSSETGLVVTKSAPISQLTLLVNVPLWPPLSGDKSELGPALAVAVADESENWTSSSAAEESPVLFRSIVRLRLATLFWSMDGKRRHGVSGLLEPGQAANGAVLVANDSKCPENDWLSGSMFL